MGKKKDAHKSYGQKLISLFVMLLASGETFSLTDLARKLTCSKQTVIRLIDDLDKSYKVEIDESRVGNRAYYRIKRPGNIPPVAISEMEMAILQMCRDFTAHLLGNRLFEEAATALMKSRRMVSHPGDERNIFAAIKTGTIDYTPHHDTIHLIISALKKKNICKITYKAITDSKVKNYSIIPLKLFSHKDTIYLHARKVSSTRKAEYDPLLAVHRIQKIELTDKTYESPDNYDFEKFFNEQFGVIKEDTFNAEIEFTGWAAKYVTERIWSPDQKIIRTGKDRILLQFTSSSDAEVLSWVLWFGEEAHILRPKSLVNEIKRRIKHMGQNYNI